MAGPSLKEIKVEEEIKKLKEQLKEAQNALARERECVDFYADKENWNGSGAIIDSDQEENESQYSYGEKYYEEKGGKLARETQAARDE